jgi:hypothetical protein
MDMSETDPNKSQLSGSAVPEQDQEAQSRLRREAFAFGGEGLSAAHRKLVTLIFGDVGDFAEYVGGAVAPTQPQPEADEDAWRELVRETFDIGPNHLSLEQVAELLTKRHRHLCLLRAMLDDAEIVPSPWVTAIEYMASRTPLL